MNISKFVPPHTPSPFYLSGPASGHKSINSTFPIDISISLLQQSLCQLMITKMFHSHSKTYKKLRYFQLAPSMVHGLHLKCLKM